MNKVLKSKDGLYIIKLDNDVLIKYIHHYLLRNNPYYLAQSYRFSREAGGGIDIFCKKIDN